MKKRHQLSDIFVNSYETIGKRDLNINLWQCEMYLMQARQCN